MPTIGPPAFLVFTPPNGIQAGFELIFSWQLWPPRLTHISDSIGSSVIATLFVNGNQIWSSSPVPVLSDNIGGDVVAESTALVQESLSFDPNSSAANLLYASGSKSLLLQVVGNGPHNAPFTAQANLTAVPAPFFGTWWAWAPTPSTAAWKSTYGLSGLFSNISTASLTVLRATLVENNLSDNKITQLQTLNLGPVGPGTNTGSVGFSPITQSWQWLDDVTFVGVGPTVKNFAYTVQLNAQDPWGNSYQATSPSLPLVVSVSLAKINDQTAALGGAASAANLTAAAAAVAAVAAGTPPPADIPLWATAGGLFAAAATAYAAAQAFGSSAKDPPTPDPLYKEVVAVKTVEIPAQLSGSSLLDASATLYRQVLGIAARHEALSVIEGKILGASNVKDQAGMDQQIVRYREITKQMQEIALQLPDATAKAIQAVQSDRTINDPKIAVLLSQWKETGIPQEVKQFWAKFGLPEGVLSAIESIIRQLPLELLTAPPHQWINTMSLRVANWAFGTASQGNSRISF